MVTCINSRGWQCGCVLEVLEEITSQAAIIFFTMERTAYRF